MNYKDYTDMKYLPMSELKVMGSVFVDKTTKYRNAYREILQINENEYSNIVETPMLIKQRLFKNFEIKGMVKVASKDIILEVAKDIVDKNKKINIPQDVRKSILKKYIDNAKDITVITTWLIMNIDKYIRNTTTGEMKHLFPELTKNDQMFLGKHNDPQLHYSIQDYKDVTRSSYETSRKALEKMTELKFYEKTKVSKKFVYKPTQLLIETIKGGH